MCSSHHSLHSLYTLSNLEPILSLTVSKSLCTGVRRVGKGVEEVHWPRDELLLEAEVCHQKGHCIAGKIKSAKYM